MQAIERRRARMGDVETPTPQQLGVLDDSLAPVSGERNYSMVTPGPSVGFKRPWPPSTAKVHQILLDITRQSSAEEEEEALTPQKKLLNSIDKVEKVVMEEIQKMKSTPSAKRAEREKRVRTLMSMRWWVIRRRSVSTTSSSDDSKEGEVDDLIYWWYMFLSF